MKWWNPMKHSHWLIMKELSKEQSHGQLKPIDFHCRLSFPDTCTKQKNCICTWRHFSMKLLTQKLWRKRHHWTYFQNPSIFQTSCTVLTFHNSECEVCILLTENIIITILLDEKFWQHVQPNPNYLNLQLLDLGLMWKSTSNTNNNSLDIHLSDKPQSICLSSHRWKQPCFGYKTII